MDMPQFVRIHLQMDIWIISSLELLQVELLLDICIHLSEMNPWAGAPSDPVRFLSAKELWSGGCLVIALLLPPGPHPVLFSSISYLLPSQYAQQVLLGTINQTVTDLMVMQSHGSWFPFNNLQRYSINISHQDWESKSTQSPRSVITQHSQGSQEPKSN